MPDTPADDVLIAPPSPEELLPTAWWPWLLTIGIVLLLSAGLGLWWWRRKQRPTGPPAPRAHAKALAALARCPTEHCADTATRVSLILRRYLAEATEDPALYETHEELIARQSALEDLSDELRQRCRDLFEQLARLKYAPAPTEGDPASLRDEAGRLLQALNQEIAA